MTPVYLIIGNGRLAKHFTCYLKLLELKYSQYQRGDTMESFYQKIRLASHILVLINDDAIDAFIEDKLYNFLDEKIIIHCSGALQSAYAYSVHPLMSFGYSLYDIETYRSIPFICEKIPLQVSTTSVTQTTTLLPRKNLEFKQLLPGFQNKFYYIDPQNKSYYHALCVIANNFTTILWQGVKKRMLDNVGLEFSAMAAISRQTMLNINTDIDNALTGPLSRNDEKTIQNHLAILDNDAIAILYKAFDQFYRIELAERAVVR